MLQCLLAAHLDPCSACRKQANVLSRGIPSVSRPAAYVSSRRLMAG